jgi:uncharacterized membrane protein
MTSPTLERNVRTIERIEAEASARRSLVERFGDRITAFAGSPWFLASHVLWFAVWIFANTRRPDPIDPYPFTFLTFLVSLEAIVLTSFVLMSQNHAEKQARRRAALDLQINLLAEEEMTKLLNGVSAIGEHLGIVGLFDDPETQDMTTRTDVEALAQAVEEDPKSAKAPH